MSRALILPGFRSGGDRFAHQAKAQLAACMLAAGAGVEVIPVWNKSDRERTIIGTEPIQTRTAADIAVKQLGWDKPYFLDADHITAKSIDRFVGSCDFFTLDVAEDIGKAAAPSDVEAFVVRHLELIGSVRVPGIAAPLRTDLASVTRTCAKFLVAAQAAASIYKGLVEQKGDGNFVPKISTDETDSPQRPVELIVILAGIADENIPIQTIGPRFTGRFNKGVDYVGDVEGCAREFNEDIAAIDFAVKRYGLPENLNLSVDSGSDRFAIYGAIHAAVVKSKAGVHLKTAGTTWLEELIGLAKGAGEGLSISAEIYREAFEHADELCKPYASVIDIDFAKLPKPRAVDGWTSERFISALRHDQAKTAFNASLRQLLHVGYKAAAGMGPRYLNAPEANASIVAKNVTANLYERHIKPIFLGQA